MASVFKRGRWIDANGRKCTKHTPGAKWAEMRHTDMRLTMNVYTDPRIFDLAGAVENLPALPTTRPDANVIPGWRESVTTRSAAIRFCSAVSGIGAAPGDSSLSLVTGGDRQQKTPSGRDGVFKRAKGVEPSTFTLAT